MKILYGVQGTGNGHISRARAMNKYLREFGVEVDYIFSGREREKYFDMEEFGDWRCYKGLTFLHSAGQLNIMRTLKEAKIRQVWRDINELKLDAYDLIVTDFEPITAWAARRAGRICLGVGHQYAFNHSVPLRGHNFVGRKIMALFAPASESLGLHWHHFNQPILPPIVDMDHIDDPVDEKKILVYLGFEDSEQVVSLLEPFEDYTFCHYGPFPEYESRGHIKLKPLSRDGFKYDLATASGVICNAGFELSSEAVQLGKKLLVKPLIGQLEQLSNARAMEELGLAMTMDTLNSESVADWLNNFHAPQVEYPNVAKAIARWIKDREWERKGSKEELIKALWQAVESRGVERFKSNPLPLCLAV
ncbi:MJ1255/VC2487 family glycosyltransferase [Teredinibacter haidensis]|uniref:MJ1255/VC2487 family glycosyltransferase n=1 Tax=Teredinibacter haidensis TaxID=2731755 RepID=UPI000948D9FF|nr:MJ1255/VC2487 family glycosyltransferase [Teredinibacter haidensis]